jgi:hypothetical protein
MGAFYVESLSKIIFEDINEDYGRGKYGEFDVIIRKADGYINVTKLCADGGKRYSNWSRLDSAKSFVDEVCSATHIRATEILHSINGGRGEISDTIKGTYAHPYLVPHIASWVSPKFAVMVSQITNNYIVREYERTIEQKDDKIDELQKKLDEMLGKQDEMLERTDNVLDNLQDANDKLDVLTIHHNVALDQRVVPPKEEKTNDVFSLYKVETKEEVAYYVSRTQRQGMNKVYNRLNEKYDSVEKLLSLDQPNGRNLFIRLRECGDYTITRNTIKTDDEAKLIAKILFLHEERREETPIDETKIDLDTLEKLTVIKLRNICRENGITRYSGLTKQRLVDLIRAYFL